MRTRFTILMEKIMFTCYSLVICLSAFFFALSRQIYFVYTLIIGYVLMDFVKKNNIWG